jgi:quinol monooxygenase YgiN
MTMAVVALLELRLKPDALEKSYQVIDEVLVATRAFAGNQGVTVLIDTEDPAHVIVHESWESLEHDNAYRAWRATPEGVSALGDVIVAAPTLTRLTVSGAG